MSKSGVQRNRMLQILSADPRFLDLEVSTRFSAHYIMVNKMTAEHIITAEECKKFEEFLSEHHRVIGGGGESLLERGVREHNVLSISNLYCNVYFSELGRLLSVDEKRAEKVCVSTACMPLRKRDVMVYDVMWCTQHICKDHVCLCVSSV
ncbi:hypothetical protein EON65_29150 [archaeon]|nr:MAG: hypothetical protein EON65_29150 [archaeon]